MTRGGGGFTVGPLSHWLTSFDSLWGRAGVALGNALVIGRGWKQIFLSALLNIGVYGSLPNHTGENVSDLLPRGREANECWGPLRTGCGKFLYGSVE